MRARRDERTLEEEIEAMSGNGGTESGTGDAPDALRGLGGDAGAERSHR